MRTRPTNFAIVTLLGLMLTAVGGKTKNPPGVISAPQNLRYNVEYTCGGERVTVSRCRRDSDQPGFPATTPDRDYCAVSYPDRPKQGGFIVETVELRGDVVKKLQACGALETSQSAGEVESTTNNGSKGESATAAAEAYSNQGLAYYKAKDYAKAIETCKKAIALDPSLVSAYTSLALAYDAQHQWQLAISARLHSLTLRPNDANTYIVLGEDYRELKQYEQALNSYLKAIRLKPDPKVLPTANFWVGRTYYDLEKYDNAIPYLRETLRLEPAADDAALILGRTYTKLKRYPEALEAFQLTIRLKPNDPEHQFWLGYAYFFLQQYPNAVAGFKEAIRLRPNYVDAYEFLGLTYVGLDQKEEALQVYRTLERIDKSAAQDLLVAIKEMK